MHQQIVTEYRILLDLIKDTSINATILHQHLNQIDKMSEDLSAQSKSSQMESLAH